MSLSPWPFEDQSTVTAQTLHRVRARDLVEQPDAVVLHREGRDGEQRVWIIAGGRARRLEKFRADVSGALPAFGACSAEPVRWPRLQTEAEARFGDPRLKPWHWQDPKILTSGLPDRCRVFLFGPRG